MLDAAPTRVWEGRTESGIRVNCFIRRVQVASDAELAQFEAELEETRQPAIETKRILSRVEEEKEELLQRCALEQMCSNEWTLTMVLNLASAIAIIGNIQFALRHPLNSTGPMADLARGAVDGMIVKMEESGLTAHAELGRMGYDPAYDEPNPLTDP
jgi:hypothetical protein